MWGHAAIKLPFLYSCRLSSDLDWGCWIFCLRSLYLLIVEVEELDNY